MGDPRPCHQLRLETLAHPQPNHLVAALAQTLGHRQRGVNMTTGATGYDEDLGGWLRVHKTRRASWSIRSSNATTTQFTRMLDPP